MASTLEELIYNQINKPVFPSDHISTQEQAFFAFKQLLQKINQDNSKSEEHKAKLIKWLLLSNDNPHHPKPTLARFKADAAKKLLSEISNPHIIQRLFELDPYSFLNIDNKALFFAIADKLKAEQFINNLTQNENHLLSLIKLEKIERRLNRSSSNSFTENKAVIEALKAKAASFDNTTLVGMIDEGANSKITSIIIRKLLFTNDKKLLSVIDKQHNTILHHIAQLIHPRARVTTDMFYWITHQKADLMYFLSASNFAGDTFITTLLQQIKTAEQFNIISGLLNGLLHTLDKHQMRQMMQQVNSQGKSFVSLLTNNYKQFSQEYSDNLESNYCQLMNMVIDKMKGDDWQDYKQFIYNHPDVIAINFQNLPIKMPSQIRTAKRFLYKLLDLNTPNEHNFKDAMPALQASLMAPSFRFDLKAPRPLLRNLFAILDDYLMSKITEYFQQDMENFYKNFINASEGFFRLSCSNDLLDAAPLLTDYCFNHPDTIDALIEHCENSGENFLSKCYLHNKETLDAILRNHWQKLNPKQQYRLLTAPQENYRESFSYYLLSGSSNKPDDYKLKILNSLLPKQPSWALNAVADWFNQGPKHIDDRNTNIYHQIILPLIVDKANAIQLEDLTDSAQFWLKMPPAKEALKNILDLYFNKIKSDSTLEPALVGRIFHMCDLALSEKTDASTNLFDNIVNYHRRTLDSLFEPEETNTKKSLIKLNDYLTELGIEQTPSDFDNKNNLEATTSASIELTTILGQHSVIEKATANELKTQQRRASQVSLSSDSSE